MRMKSVIVGLVAVSMMEMIASPGAAAGPLPTMVAAVGRAAPDQTIDVYWRGYGPGLAFGLAAGVIAGAAASYEGPIYYYGSPAPYPYARPIYTAPYPYPQVYGPAAYSGYFAPYGYHYGWPSRCHTQEGYGRYRPCSAN